MFEFILGTIEINLIVGTIEINLGKTEILWNFIKKFRLIVSEFWVNFEYILRKFDKILRNCLKIAKEIIRNCSGKLIKISLETFRRIEIFLVNFR